MYLEQSGEYVYWCQGVKGYVALPILIVWVFYAVFILLQRMVHVKVEFAIQMPIVFESFQRHDDNASAEMVGKETGLVVLVRWFFFSLNFFPCHSSVTSFLAIFTKLKGYYCANSVFISHQTSTNVSHPVTLTVTQRLSALIQKDLMNAIASRVTLVMVLTAHVS